MPPRKRSPKKWTLYPDHHDEVSRLLNEEKENLTFTFHPVDTDKDSTKQYDTNIMGRFVCRGATCSKSGWSSKMIAIRIRMYEGGKYNARVYYQRCKSCNQLSKPVLDDGSYAERVVYRLRKWSGVEVERPVYGGGQKSRGPHDSGLCEGCKDGHCAYLARGGGGGGYLLLGDYN